MSDTMTAAEAAALLGLTRAYVVRLVHQGKLRGERIGPERRGVWQIERASVEALQVVRSQVRSEPQSSAQNAAQEGATEAK